MDLKSRFISQRENSLNKEVKKGKKKISKTKWRKHLLLYFYSRESPETRYKDLTFNYNKLMILFFSYGGYITETSLNCCTYSFFKGRIKTINDFNRMIKESISFEEYFLFCFYYLKKNPKKITISMFWIIQNSLDDFIYFKESYNYSFNKIKKEAMEVISEKDFKKLFKEDFSLPKKEAKEYNPGLDALKKL